MTCGLCRKDRADCACDPMTAPVPPGDFPAAPAKPARWDWNEARCGHWFNGEQCREPAGHAPPCRTPVEPQQASVELTCERDADELIERLGALRPALLTFVAEKMGLFVTELLHHKSMVVREGAVYGLAGAADEIAEMVKSDPSPTIRGVALESTTMETASAECVLCGKPECVAERGGRRCMFDQQASAEGERDGMCWLFRHVGDRLEHCQRDHGHGGVCEWPAPQQQASAEGDRVEQPEPDVGEPEAVGVDALPGYGHGFAAGRRWRSGWQGGSVAKGGSGASAEGDRPTAAQGQCWKCGEFTFATGCFMAAGWKRKAKKELETAVYRRMTNRISLREAEARGYAKGLEALRSFTVHAGGCNDRTVPSCQSIGAYGPCDCGLDRALASADAKGTP